MAENIINKHLKNNIEFFFLTLMKTFAKYNIFLT